ncbi:MAG: thioredoxin-disulfide reductase [Eubacterium sp.]|jgi:thioredoxin reductase (NADPH)|nr:thioredoxin-disulfide reductase [Eubacterium sp.]
MYDIIVVGAGTAGLSAAVYGARAGKRVLVLEQKNAGGQIVNSPEVDNYPGIKHISGFEFIQRLQEQAEEAGAQIQYAPAEAIRCEGEKKLVRCGDEELACNSIILATGMVYRKLGLEREEHLTGKGVSYCAVCDGAFFRGKDTAVVGGGNTALEDALYLSEICRRVYLIHRRDRFRGENTMVNKLLQIKNVEFILDSVVTELRGKEQLSGIIVKNKVSGIVNELSVNGLFVAVGQNPENERFRDVVELDAHGYIKADESCRTSVLGIYAAGDCRTKQVHQLVTAAADGAVAALAACGQIE